MSVVTSQYVRKPLYVEAVQITPENLDAVAEWCQGQVKQEERERVRYIRVRVHNPITPRQTKAFIGDWILYTTKGYKIYPNNAFVSTFDPIPQPQKVAPKQETKAA